MSYRSRVWDVLGQWWLMLVISIAALFLTTAVTIAYYAPIMGWFGFIYLIAGMLSTGAVSLLVGRGARQLSQSASFLWFGIAGIAAVGLTMIYSLFSASSSGTPNDVVYGFQFAHSVVCLLASMIVCAAWCGWTALQNRRAIATGARART
ncbi:MAG: hypothetical protein ACTH2U_12615 [Brevibacterium sp.]